MTKIVALLAILVGLLILWGSYRKVSNMSHTLEIRDDPFRRPCFFLCCLTTVGCFLMATDILFDWAG